MTFLFLVFLKSLILTPFFSCTHYFDFILNQNFWINHFASNIVVNLVFFSIKFSQCTLLISLCQKVTIRISSITMDFSYICINNYILNPQFKILIYIAITIVVINTMMIFVYIIPCIFTTIVINK